ncbi:MAG: hypothetical protein ACW98X_20765 [Promethearchaeota archaeon]|jgi:hypothetical protein
MFQIITFIVSISTIIWSFYSPLWAWAPIAIIDLFICMQNWAVKRRYKYSHISDLSSEANNLLQQYGHYFASPFASKDFSASAATCQFAGIILAIVCAFHGIWWTIALGIINWFVMSKIAISLSPASVLAQSPNLQVAHDEVVEYFNSRQGK